MTVAQWSTTAALNVVSSGTIGTGGVNINEGMFPSGVNDAMRDLMAQLKTFLTASTFATTGPLIVGHTAQLAIANTDNVQIIGTTVANVGLGMLSFVNGGQAHVDFYSSPSGTIGTYAPVVSGGSLGGLNWYGAQQTGTAANWSRAAQIRAEVDGTVTDGAGADMPGRIIFSTSPDGSGTIAERLRIDAAGAVTIAAGGAFVLPQAAAPAPTVEGDMRWDTDDNHFAVGDGSGTRKVGKTPTMQIFSTPGAFTYTPTAGARFADFEACGGGGGSGGINGAGAGTSAATGGGGGGFSGSTGIIDITGAATFSGSIGAAGTAGTSAANGGNGGNTTMVVGATTYTWGGGTGSDFVIAGASAGSLDGGVAGVGTNVVGCGQQGGHGIRGNQGTNTDNNVTAGAGGGSLFGTGGAGRHSITNPTSGAGVAGVGFGSGAGGAFSIASASNINGAVGKAGYMRVTEYY